jgi:hypothetical protein
VQSSVARSDCFGGANTIAFADAIGSDPQPNAVTFIYSDDFASTNRIGLR